MEVTDPTLFDLAPFTRTAAEPEWPAWFRVGKTTPAGHTQNVARGRHPFGAALGPDDHTCGDCGHCYAHRVANVYWKCDLIPPTSGLATDLRKRWRACVHWEPTE